MSLIEQTKKKHKIVTIAYEVIDKITMLKLQESKYLRRASQLLLSIEAHNFVSGNHLRVLICGIIHYCVYPNDCNEVNSNKDAP